MNYVLSNPELIDKKFILSQLERKPQIVEKYVSQHELYNVFVRDQTPSNVKNHGDMTLLKTFVTEQNAIDWIYKNGKEIIDEHYSNG